MTWQNIFNIKVKEKEKEDYFVYDFPDKIKKYLELKKLVIQATFWSIKSSDIVDIKCIN